MLYKIGWVVLSVNVWIFVEKEKNIKKEGGKSIFKYCIIFFKNLNKRCKNWKY